LPHGHHLFQHLQLPRLHEPDFILFLFVADADAQQLGIEDFHMKELGTPQQHGHLPGSKCMDALQGKEHFQIMTIKSPVKDYQLVYQ